MRKSIDSLSLLVSDVLEMDPLSEAWFIFCNRHRDKIKILCSTRQHAHAIDIIWMSVVNR